MTWAGWSQKLNILALTTSRGSLLLINPDLPGAALPMEKAEASITCGAWNTQTLLALASQNNKVLYGIFWRRVDWHLLRLSVDAAVARFCRHAKGFGCPREAV